MTLVVFQGRVQSRFYCQWTFARLTTIA